MILPKVPPFFDCFHTGIDGCGILVARKEVTPMAADCHIHMVLDGVDWKASIARGIDDGLIRSRLENYARLGYTYLRDGGDRWGVGARARDLAPEYGIVYKTPLAPLCKEGHYGSFIGLSWQDMGDYARLVQDLRRQGADFIKLMISGLMDFDRYGVLTQPGLEAPQIRELIHIAHSEGMAVMAHCNGARTAEAAAAAGLDSAEHGAYLDDDALAAMAGMGTVWVPTLSTIGNLLGKGRFDDGAVAAILDSALENIARFRAMGGLVAPGSDAGAWAVPHDCCTEEGWLQKAGLSDGDIQAGAAAIIEKF